MTLDAGTRLGRYEIRSKIGKGGMGEAYLAQLDRKVALKILPADLAATRTACAVSFWKRRPRPRSIIPTLN